MVNLNCCLFIHLFIHFLQKPPRHLLSNYQFLMKRTQQFQTKDDVIARPDGTVLKRLKPGRNTNLKLHNVSSVSNHTFSLDVLLAADNMLPSHNVHCANLLAPFNINSTCFHKFSSIIQVRIFKWIRVNWIILHIMLLLRFK